MPSATWIKAPHDFRTAATPVVRVRWLRDTRSISRGELLAWLRSGPRRAMPYSRAGPHPPDIRIGVASGADQAPTDPDSASDPPLATALGKEQSVGTATVLICAAPLGHSCRLAIPMASGILSTVTALRSPTPSKQPPLRRRPARCPLRLDEGSATGRRRRAQRLRDQHQRHSALSPWPHTASNHTLAMGSLPSLSPGRSKP